MPLANDASVRAFKCPSCGAPLEPENGTLTMKCPYCGGTVIIPESLRTPAPRSGPTMGEVFDFGLSSLNMGQIVGNAMRLPDAIRLAKQGQIDEAANIYSQITGMEHANAVKSVQAMAAGHAVSLTPGSGVTWGSGQPGVTISPSAQRASASFSPPTPSISYKPPSSSVSRTTADAKKSGGRGCGLLLGILAAVVVLIVVLVGGGIFFFARGQTSGSLLPLGFANKTMAFGMEGIGPGQFEDARSVGVDGSGNIIVADYQSGRIQTFDPRGKFVSGFSISTGSQKVYVTGLAVSRSGQIYVAHDWKIFIYDQNGAQLGQIADDNHRYNDVTVGADGKLYAIANGENIVRFKPDYSIDLEIPATFTNATNNSELDAHLAVDGLGNMYIVGSFNYLVLKFSPDGKFVNRFGGEAQDPSSSEPGKFRTPRAIAVDGYGRVFVSDFFDIKVFDSDGTYVNKIDIGGGPFGVAIDGQNFLYTVTTDKNVVKYAVQKPGSG